MTPDKESGHSAQGSFINLRPENAITTVIKLVCSHQCWSLANHLLQQETTTSWIHEEVSWLAIV
uniref:Uncharacterized protein n=1 Tax=Salix viminalis TaxID=40686 RepID=A0A6N2NBV9_SALVM